MGPLTPTCSAGRRLVGSPVDRHHLRCRSRRPTSRATPESYRPAPTPSPLDVYVPSRHRAPSYCGSRVGANPQPPIDSGDRLEHTAVSPEECSAVTAPPALQGLAADGHLQQPKAVGASLLIPPALAAPPPGRHTRQRRSYRGPRPSGGESGQGCSAMNALGWPTYLHAGRDDAASPWVRLSDRAGSAAKSMGLGQRDAQPLPLCAAPAAPPPLMRFPAGVPPRISSTAAASISPDSARICEICGRSGHRRSPYAGSVGRDTRDVGCSSSLPSSQP